MNNKKSSPCSLLTNQTHHHQLMLLSLNFSEIDIPKTRALREGKMVTREVALNENTHSNRGIVIGHENQRRVPNPSGNSVGRGRRRRRHIYRSFALQFSLSGVCFGGRIRRRRTSESPDEKTRFPKQTACRLLLL